MKWMLIQSSDANKKSNYITALVQEWQRLQYFQLVDAADKPEQYADKANLLIQTTIKSQGKLGNWLNNSLKHKPTIKKWHIDKIILCGFFHKIETDLSQLFIVNNSNITFSEEEKTFIQSHDFSFLTYDEKVKALIETTFPEQKTQLYNPIILNIFQPLNWDDSQQVKQVHSSGEDYFLVNSIGQNLDYSVNILKGFSIFKKWQKSNMKILFLMDNVQELQGTIANYKYRDDVHIINQPEEKERANIIASAYCTIHLTTEDSDNIFARQSAKCLVPILLKQNSTMLSWLDNNAFYIDEISPETLGQAFITMYKAENIRAKHIDYMEKNPLI